MSQDNSIIIEAWNTVLFDKFVRFKHLLIDGLAGHSDEALSRHPPREGTRVLDVGCGFGDSTVKIAAAVGAPTTAPSRASARCSSTCLAQPCATSGERSSPMAN